MVPGKFTDACACASDAGKVIGSRPDGSASPHSRAAIAVSLRAPTTLSAPLPETENRYAHEVGAVSVPVQRTDQAAGSPGMDGAALTAGTGSVCVATGVPLKSVLP